MAFNVTLRQSGRQFQVEPDEPVLTAALRQGIGLPYGCKSATQRMPTSPQPTMSTRGRRKFRVAFMVDAL